jgi:hypothetical protein
MNKISAKQVSSLFILLAGLLFFTGCSTLVSSRYQKKEAMRHFSGGEYRKSAEIIDSYAKARAGTGDELMWYLEGGTVHFIIEDYPGSLKAFEKAEDVLNDYENRATFNLRSAAAETGAAYTNANALPYTGLFFEKIIINTYKAMDYLAMGNPDAASVEMRRARFRQKMAQRQHEIDLIEEYKYEAPKYTGAKVPGFSPEAILNNKKVKEDLEWIKKHSKNFDYGNVVNPTVTFFSAIDFLAQNEPYKALFDFRVLYRIDPANIMFKRCYVSLMRQLGERIPEKLKRVKGFDFPLNKKVVYVLFEDGLVPARKEKLFELILPPPVGYTGIAYPILEYFPSDAAYLQITDEKGHQHRTRTVGDFGDISSFALDKQLTEIITRAVIGAMVKEATSITLQYTAKHIGNNIQSGAGDIAQLIVFAIMQVYKKMFNRADVRCWQTLPKQVQAAVFPKTGHGIFKLSVKAKDGKIMNSANVNVGNSDSITIILVKSNGFDTMRLKIFDF